MIATAQHPSAFARYWHTPEAWVLLLVIALHVAIALALVSLRSATTAPVLDVLSIRMLQASPPVEAPVKPKPTPPKPVPVKKPPPKPVVKRVVAAKPVAAPKPEPKPLPIEQPVPAIKTPPTPVPDEPALAPAVVPPRFDAAYLNNPTPRYPALSRRNGETGRVLLRVQVGADGLPKTITIAESSQFARLDEAALAAVKRWRFVPARQGDQAITEWVLVPLQFKLTR